MRYSDIKVGDIYFADLEPVKKYEFGGNHLSLVLSKGKDKRTVTIISLTSKESGVGTNKIDVGLIPTLPKRISHDKHGKEIKSYVVLDQVRTVVSNRIQYIKDGKKNDGTDNFIECSIDPFLFSEIVQRLADLVITNLKNKDEIAKYHKESFFHYCVKEIINLTYDVIKEKEDIADKKNEIKYLYANALAIEKGFLIDAYLDANDVKNKVLEKIHEIVLAPVE